MTEYYITNSDEGAVRTELEIDYVDEAPQQERPWLLWLFIKMETLTEEGFATDAEHQRLDAKLALLKERLMHEIDAVGVGQKEEEGWLELYFYAPSAKKFQNIAAEVLGSTFVTDSGATRDTKWEHYLYTLYPDALMLQQLQSRHVINELIEAGDDLGKVREVEHYLGFLTETQAKRVAEELYLHGLEMKDISYNSSEEHGYTLVLTQEHVIDSELLEELAFLLITTAEKEHGIYVGWSSGVVS